MERRVVVAGWRLRDVLAHLVRGAEMTYGSLTVDLLRGGFRPDASVRNATRRLVPPVPGAGRSTARRGHSAFHLVGANEGWGWPSPGAQRRAFRRVGLDVDVAPADVAPALDPFAGGA